MVNRGVPSGVPNRVRHGTPIGVLRGVLRDDRGAVTAEFAITVPAVILVLGVVLSALFLGAERIALTSLAGDVARLEARGDAALAAVRIGAFTGSPTIERERVGGILCVTATRGGSGILAPLMVAGRGCAAVAEWPNE